MVRRAIEELNISSKYKRQLVRAVSRRSNQLAEMAIIKSIESNITGEHRSLSHLYKREVGTFAELDLLDLLEEHTDGNGAFDWDAVLQGAVLFSNPMALADFDAAKTVPGKKSGFTAPSERVENAGWWVFTFEVDGTSRQDLEMQLDWFAGKPEQAPFNVAHKALSRFADYRGYSAIFSGGKSVHIHLLFDIRHLSHKLAQSTKNLKVQHWEGDVPDRDLAGLHQLLWVDVAETVNRSLGTNVRFDPFLRFYHQKRRSPWGIRTLTKASALHGFAEGDEVEQIVIQERLSTRTLAPKGSRPLVTFEKSKAITNASRTSTNRPSRRSVVQPNASAMISDFHDYLRNEGWGEYPKPAAFVYDGSHNVLSFYNDAADVNPSTIVRGDYRQLLFGGAGAPTNPVFLPNELTLDETLDLLFPPGSQGFTGASRSTGRKTFHPLNRYAEQATNKASARREAAKILEAVSQSPGAILVQAPEGIGKTYTLMNIAMEQRWDEDKIRFDNAKARGDEPVFAQGHTIIACRSYDQVYEKHDELLSVENAPAGAIVLKSVGKLYGEARELLKVGQELTTADAGANNCQSLIEAIQKLQPQVYKKMKELRDEAWPIHNGSRTHVPNAFVFMVHDLLKIWPHSFYGRAFLHPEFPDNLDPLAIQRCAQEMRPHRVIYDEVEWSDLVTVVPTGQVRLARKVRKECERIAQMPWDESSLATRVGAFSSVMSDQGNKSMQFERCDEIIRTKFRKKKDLIRVDSAKFPFGKGSEEKNIYAGVTGGSYYCKPTRWAASLGCPVIILTTEDLPRLVANGINRQSKNGKPYQLVNLTFTPHLFQETVPLSFDERVRMPRETSEAGDLESVKELAEELLGQDRDFVISNGLSSLDQKWHDHHTTHRSARGRNDLKSKTIATFLTYPGLDEYAKYCVLGHAFGISNPVKVAYRDLLYQDLGRNLGFRYTAAPGQYPHHVYVKASLFRDLNQLTSAGIPGAEFERYRFQLVRS